MIVQAHNLDVIPGGGLTVVHVKQYQTDGNIVFKLFSRNGELTIPATFTGCTVRGTKTDGNGYSANATCSYASNEVTVAITEQMTAVAGREPYEITITANSKVLITATFILDVQRAALDADTVTSESVIKEVETIVEDYIEDHPGLFVVDDTLTQSNEAADAKVTGDEIRDLKSAINIEALEVSTYEDTYNALLSRGMFENGVYNPTNDTTNKTLKYRISSRKSISFPYDAKLEIDNGFKIYVYRYNGSSWVAAGWQSGTFKIASGTYYHFQIARTTDNTSETADCSEFLSSVKVVNTPIKTFISDISNYIDASLSFISDKLIKITVERGTWTYSEAIVDGSSNTQRLRSTKLYKVSKGMQVIFYSPTILCYAHVVSDLYDGEILQAVGWSDSYSTKIENMFTVEYDGYLILNYKNQAGDTIQTSDYDGYTYICSDFAYNIPEKAVHVYQFGGNGNDWCFVRTPSNYDPSRKKPYPFVICNHGNGWVMTGTIHHANWTKRTMYVPLTDPDYINSPTQYNGTDDESLWYSNPTIEALLSAGFVVCGCENYGDNLYGNNDCRNACVDFFNHMVGHYNVENRCYMIGASNGAMTSLNAAYILQGQVKAMILQYPLTCLVNQYNSHAAHQSEIRAAYNITDSSISSSDLAKAVATHDPLTTDVVSGIKVGTVPPIKMWYSESDSVVNYQQNALALKTLLDNSNKVVSTVVATGAHGDASHFNPTATVEWFEDN